MKNYTIESFSRTKLIFYFAIISSLASGIIAHFFFANLGATFAPPSSFAVFAVCLYAYNHFFWKWKFLRMLCFVPCFDGDWIGEVEIHEKDGNSTTIPIKAKIAQTWTQIDIIFTSDETISECRNLHLDYRNQKTATLLWVYSVRPRNITSPDSYGQGVTEMRSDNLFTIKKLEGSYFSTKKRGGTISLKKQ